MMIITCKTGKVKAKVFRGKFLGFTPVLFRESEVKVVLTSRFVCNISWEDTS